MTSVQEPQLLVDGDGPVRTLRLNRPDRHNAQTPQMWSEFAEAGRSLCADPQVRCVVVVGEGSSFSSGIDLDQMRDPEGFIPWLAAHPTGDPDPMLPAIDRAQEAFRWMPRAPFPVVAAVTGVAMGAGAQLALSCDFRIVAHDARLAIKEVSYGLVPDLGATATLPPLVGRERALDLILTGREFSGDEGVELGAALRALPAADVVADAREYADTLAAAPRHALAYAKAAVDEPDRERNDRITAVGQAVCIRNSKPS